MHNGAFQLNKVRRILRTQGIEIVVKIPALNEFNEPTKDTRDVKIKGIFHESVSHSLQGLNTSEAGTLRKKSSPMLLCLWEDIAEVLHPKDSIFFNNKTYNISGIQNLGESNLIADISLEEVQS